MALFGEFSTPSATNGFVSHLVDGTLLKVRSIPICWYPMLMRKALAAGFFHRGLIDRSDAFS